MAGYFREPHPQLAVQLDAHQERLRSQCPADIRRLVTGLVLGGGYGRGEGGIARGPNGDQLFNDLDYFLFSSDPGDDRLIKWVRQWEKDETAALGIDVECVILPASKIRSPEPTMMFSDLASGHRVVIGPDNLLDEWRTRLPPSAIPLGEATRLLWNRGSGLYFAGIEIDSGAPDSVFVQRNLFKAKLALGDAVLCLHRAYCALADERAQRLDALTDPLLTDEIRQWHREAVGFKRSPRIENLSTRQLESELRAVTQAWARIFLAVESQRLRLRGELAFNNLQDYANLRFSLFPQEPLIRNLMLATRDRALRGGGLLPFWDYPRGALYRALADLLHTRLDDRDYAHTERWIPAATPQSPPADHLKLYRKWWHLYS